MKKKLDVHAITSELRGKSAFFPGGEQKSERANARTNERKKTRHSFNIFEDQLLALKELVLMKEKADGSTVFLADLAREALDLYIKQEHADERTEERVNVRTNERVNRGSDEGRNWRMDEQANE